MTTDDKGRVICDRRRQGEIYYETGQVHVTALAMDSQGQLLALPNGILYRITGKQKAFVLYDGSLPEVRAIVPAPDGTSTGCSGGRRGSPGRTAVERGLLSPALPCHGFDDVW